MRRCEQIMKMRLCGRKSARSGNGVVGRRLNDKIDRCALNQGERKGRRAGPSRSSTGVIILYFGGFLGSELERIETSVRGSATLVGPQSLLQAPIQWVVHGN